MSARWSAFLVWALVAASAVAWGLNLFARPAPVPPQAVVAQPSAAAGGDWSRVFGAAPPPAPVMAEAAPPPAPEASRFQLIGVVAPRPAAAKGQGVALIAVDGRMPRAYRVGAVVDGEHVLQSVAPRAVAIGPRQGPAVVTLELPALPPPATGTPGAMPAAMPDTVPGAMPPPAALPPAAALPLPPQAMPVPAPRLRALPGPMLPGQVQPVVPMLAVPVEPAQGGDGQPQPVPGHALTR